MLLRSSKDVVKAARAPTAERRIRWLLLAVWLIHLLVYVWVVPPWQHYDEPTHFEYAALIRELGRLPTFDEQLPSLRRAIATSMVETGFFRRRDVPLTPPALDAPNLSLGINERGHPPLYYALVALATTPLRAAPITSQLYAARLCSVALALLLFGAAYLMLRLLTGDDWSLRCWILAVLVLQPAFADNMSAVNSDVLANLVALLVLLVGVWFLRRPGWRQLLLGLALLILAVNVKRTLLIYGLLLPIAWLVALPGRTRRGLLSAAAVGLIGLLAWLLIQPWPLADWSSSPPDITGYVSQPPLQRLYLSNPLPAAPAIEPQSGAAAFALATTPGRPEPMLTQRLYPFRLPEVVGQTLTLAAWMRADRERLPASSPILQVDSQVISRSLSLGTGWQLVTLTATVPLQTRALAVQLRGPAAPGVVFYDSLALVQGGAANLPGPDEQDGSLEVGLIEPTPRNLVRNAGAERHIPPLSNVLPVLIGPTHDGRNLDQAGSLRVLSTLFDPVWIAAIYPRQALLLFRGFWGIFGWGEVSVSPGWFMVLGILVLASLFGGARFIWGRHWRGRVETHEWQVRAWWLCLAAVALGWAAAMLRVHVQPFLGFIIWSFGRYTFVTMVPSLFLFVTGLRELFPAPARNFGLAYVICFLLIFALAALLTLSTAYS